jgi:hypothetical protein
MNDAVAGAAAGAAANAAANAVSAVRRKVADRFGARLDDAELGRKLEIVLWNTTLESCKSDGIPLEWTSSFTKSFRERYTSRAVGLDVFNFATNPTLRADLQSGRLGVKAMLRMSPYELNPAVWDPVFDRVAFKQLRKELNTGDADAPDGLLQCRRCGSKKTAYVQMQTRSADEPSTIFANCIACGNRWRQ